MGGRAPTTKMPNKEKDRGKTTRPSTRSIGSNSEEKDNQGAALNQEEQPDLEPFLIDEQFDQLYPDSAPNSDNVGLNVLANIASIVVGGKTLLN
ncbi:hypothetical protein R1flu_008270 [Riccia fluitans]|uniref:Uncharacterized protein n=1 Tax=Riccia fluitans TaxID=41844 RepID=A0ABD1YBE2_9MARC